MSVPALLSRCQKVVKLRPRRDFAESYNCCCPAHEDRSPSLNVDVTTDGRVLVICRAGCSIGQIIAAAGIEFADLFPPRPNRPLRERFSAADALRLIDAEVQRAAILIAVCARHDLTAERRTRLMHAAATIRQARAACGLREVPVEF